MTRIKKSAALAVATIALLPLAVGTASADTVRSETTPTKTAPAETAPAVSAARATTFAINGANIRTRPTTGATIIGQGYRGQGVNVHCYAFGQAPPGKNTVWWRVDWNGRVGYVHSGGPNGPFSLNNTAGLPGC